MWFAPEVVDTQLFTHDALCEICPLPTLLGLLGHGFKEDDVKGPHKAGRTKNIYQIIVQRVFFFHRLLFTIFGIKNAECRYHSILIVERTFISIGGQKFGQAQILPIK